MKNEGQTLEEQHGELKVRWEAASMPLREFPHKWTTKWGSHWHKLKHNSDRDDIQLKPI